MQIIISMICRDAMPLVSREDASHLLAQQSINDCVVVIFISDFIIYILK